MRTEELRVETYHGTIAEVCSYVHTGSGRLELVESWRFAQLAVYYGFVAEEFLCVH